MASNWLSKHDWLQNDAVFYVFLGFLLFILVLFRDSLGLDLPKASLIAVGLSTITLKIRSLRSDRETRYFDSVVKYWHETVRDIATSHHLLLADEEEVGKAWQELSTKDKIGLSVFNQRCIDCMTVILYYTRSKEYKAAWSNNFEAYLKKPIPSYLWHEDIMRCRSSISGTDLAFLGPLVGQPFSPP